MYSNSVKKFDENSLIFQIVLFKIPDKGNIFNIFYVIF